MGANVADFVGVVDGGGVKQCMTAPKLPVQLVTPQFIEGIAEVLQYGAKKYAENNWKRGMSWTTVLGGTMRHLLAIMRCEDTDAESGLPHCLHAACGLMFLHWYMTHPSHTELDDRT